MSTLLELSGSGASSYGDGIDSGGYLSCHNVEWLELNFPLLYLFRRHIKDGGGAGKFSGGVGAESALTVHDAPEGKIKGIAFGVAGLRNSGQGIFGGYPGAPSLLVLLEGTQIGDLIKENKCPENVADLGGQGRLLPYCEFDLKKDDVLYLRMASGGGYGDPLDREPESVLKSVVNGLISKETAHDIYGVVLDGNNHELNLTATQKRRNILREERLK
ncbi:MAG: hydantoinase B/oxoprolinase family protein [Bacteroidetes bacterium]|nr:hydantoinase B/oxoprolinase family protein [Bacteroidota bacterium]